MAVVFPGMMVFLLVLAVASSVSWDVSEISTVRVIGVFVLFLFADFNNFLFVLVQLIVIVVLGKFSKEAESTISVSANPWGFLLIWQRHGE